MSEDLLIGKTNFERGFTNRNKTFYLEDGDNVYRILPPMRSLAKQGRYAMFHQTHMMKKSDGKWVKFASNEEIKWENNKKVVTVADPINVKYNENMETYKALKARMESGEVTKDQLKAYFEANVQPLQPERKYYLNAINLDNQVSVLALPTTAFKALDELIVRLREAKGLDATDLESGVFFNIRRTGKGRDTAFTVEVKREPVQDPATGEILERYKRLPVGPELLEQVKIHARDLTDLFRSIDVESMEAVAAASPSERPKILDRIFTRSEESDNSDDSSEDTVTSAPGVSGVKGVNKVNVGTDGISIDGPNFVDKNYETENKARQAASVPETEKKEAQGTTTAPSTTTGDGAAKKAAMSDEDFRKMFINS